MRIAIVFGVQLAMVVLIATACFTRQASSTGLTAEQAAANRARPFVAGMAAVKLYREEKECQSSSLMEVELNQEKLGNMAQSFRKIPRYPFREYFEEAKHRHQSLSFAIADTALKKKCLDVADRHYRKIIEFYVGAIYSGIRDRARLGIDDIREIKRGRN